MYAEVASYGRYHDPISAILGTRGKVAVMRVLASAANPLQQREVARRTGMALRTVELALDDLLASGIVERVVGGRERLVRVRSAHRLTPLDPRRAPCRRRPLASAPRRAAGRRHHAESTLPSLPWPSSVVSPPVRKELGDPLDLLLLAATVPSAPAGSLALRRWVTGSPPDSVSRSARSATGSGAARGMWAVRTSAAERPSARLSWFTEQSSWCCSAATKGRYSLG